MKACSACRWFCTGHILHFLQLVYNIGEGFVHAILALQLSNPARPGTSGVCRPSQLQTFSQTGSMARAFLPAGRDGSGRTPFLRSSPLAAQLPSAAPSEAPASPARCRTCAGAPPWVEACGRRTTKGAHRCTRQVGETPSTCRGTSWDAIP